MAQATEENPLVPNSLLRALLVLMRELRAAAGRGRGRQAAPGPAAKGQEALRAAVLLTCRPGDLVCDLSGSGLGRLTAAGAALHWLDLPASPGSAFAALGAALALHATQPEEAEGASTLVVLLPAPAVRRQEWREALQLASAQAAPLLVVMLPEDGAPAKQLKSPAVPLIPVDAHDALALCRVLGESCLRARNGDGPTLIQAVLWELAGQQDPLRRHQQLLRRRGLTA